MSALIHQRIAAQADRRPDAPAIVAAAGSLTYRELDERANRLAGRLVALGVGPESRVGVQLPRSAEAITAMLAVVKAGGAYLPLDPAQPAARTARILADAAETVVLDPDFFAREAAAVAAAAARDPGVAVDPGNAAYVVHTSGSTGTPKGVLVPHEGLADLVDWHIETYRIGPGEHTAHVAALGFDASVWEIWPTLAAGATLHLPAEEERAQPERLLSWLAAEAITVTFLPTPLAEEVLRLPTPPSRLRAVLTGGDALTTTPAHGTPYELVNHYGPTEASVVTTAGPVQAGGLGLPSIGQPIRGVRVALLDPDGQPVAEGGQGELCIGGAGLARGYLGSPRLTAERFVPDPLGPPGARLYRSGDLASHRPDGSLDFHGRLDDQVQIRGFRVEPAEVAAALAEHPGVGRATVVARAGRLIGYVVPRDRDQDPDRLAESVRAAAEDRLPGPMVPARIVVIDAIPLTAHGKVDRAALPEPTSQNPEVLVRPRDAVEELIAQIWYEVLELSDRPEHVYDDFYALGGHSLLAGRLAAQLRDLFDVQLPLHLTFNTPTIAALAERLRLLEPSPGHLEVVARRHQQVAQLSDDEVEAMLARLRAR